MTPSRGTVYGYEFELGAEPKPALVVSNNGRNRSRWPTVHVVRITTVPKQERDTIVKLDPGEPVTGWVVCDDLALVRKADLGRLWGALSHRTMLKVDDSLRAVLSL